MLTKPTNQRRKLKGMQHVTCYNPTRRASLQETVEGGFCSRSITVTISYLNKWGGIFATVSRPPRVSVKEDCGITSKYSKTMISKYQNLYTRGSHQCLENRNYPLLSHLYFNMLSPQWNSLHYWERSD